MNVFADCDYSVLLTHVEFPIDELRRRERERGDRRISHAESMLANLEPQDLYDITIDTFKARMEDNADRIISAANDMEKHKSFRTLWMQYHKR